MPNQKSSSSTTEPNLENPGAPSSSFEAPPIEVVRLSRQDEIANTITHGVGVLLSLVAVVAFWRWTADDSLGLRICCTLFTAAMLAVYSFSTLSHAVQGPQLRYRLRAWDQGTIYALIAGTYSPFIWTATSGWGRAAMLTAVWFAAGLGLYSKIGTLYRINSISTLTYVLLGWLPAIPLVAHTPRDALVWMVAGGVSYTLGLFLLWQSARRVYSHAGWHIMVMLGSACHSYAIFRLVQK